MSPHDRDGAGAGCVGIAPELGRAAEALLGEGWQPSLARLLGEHHPDGPRDDLDLRMVRRWVTGRRPVPAWVPSALEAILKREAAGMLAAAAALERARSGAWPR